MQKVQYLVHKNPEWCTILSHFQSSPHPHALLLEIHFNVTLSVTWNPKSSPPFRLSTKICYLFLRYSTRVPFLDHLIAFNLIVLMRYCEEAK
jgi:hypothetical protein